MPNIGLPEILVLVVLFVGLPAAGVMIYRQVTTGQLRATPAAKKQNGPVLGRALLALGIVGAGYFYFLFDTSVEVPATTIMGQSFGGGRVNNLGLMAERQNGILVSLGLVAAGALVYFLKRGPSEDEKPCPHCAETIKAAAKVCKHCGRDLLQTAGA